MTVGLRTRIAVLVALVAVALSGVSCSGGGSSVGNLGFDCAGDASGVLCLARCNLGCATTGCSRTDIAQNEIIILEFSEAVDPGSVNSSSIRFRTASGDEPVGEFFVNGNRVEFVPTLSISGGVTFFGFTGGETYTMTIVGGKNSAEVVRGTSGRPFGSTLTCTLTSNLGIVDLNGIAPSATLVVPSSSQLLSAPLSTEIQIEFNELIDATPFLTGTLSPVAFTVRRTRDDGNGGFECDPESLPQTLAGSQALTFDASRGVSVLNFVPSQPLPGNVCVEISVTDGVADLSGRAAQPQVFAFRTIVVPLTDVEIIENFDNNLQLDVDASAGTWSGGAARFAKIGGDGRHGVFSLDIAIDRDQIVEGRRLFELNCDNTIIPPENTTTGAAIAVTDGRFFFSTMVVPRDVCLRFSGSVPPVLTVAGRFDVQGEIEVLGESVTSLHVASQPLGQLGGVGGIFGGNGGQGGDKCLGTGASPNFNGRNGGGVRVLAGHGYLGVSASTGGRGSLLYPASGLSADQQFGIASPGPTQLAYCLSAAAGGSGGGLWIAGGDGFVEGVFSGSSPLPNQTSFMGPVAPGGGAMQLFPFPPATGLQLSSQHFLVGGAGGGGAGSNATLSLAIATSRSWASGAGGGGGAGAVALRAGGSLRLAPTGRILATGGSAANYVGTSAGAQVAPAGAGSGGSVLLQTGGTAEIIGLINVEGGQGGFFNRQGGSGIGPIGGIVKIQGGDGSPGFVRLEAPTAPAVTALATVVPAVTTNSVAALSESDDLVSMRSLYYSTGLIFGPAFSHYVIEATVDGQPVVYSDDPTISSIPAGTGAAVRALFQAAALDIVTGEVQSVRPWRTSVRSSSNQTGIASDGLNGYRFMLFFDQALATSVTIDRVVVVYRN